MFIFKAESNAGGDGGGGVDGGGVDDGGVNKNTRASGESTLPQMALFISDLSFVGEVTVYLGKLKKEM